MGTDEMIVILSAFGAAVSFIAFALPFLNRSEKSERYRSVIEKKRRALFEAAKNPQKSDTMSAKDSMAVMFRVEQMLGEFGERMRDQMLQAGIRSPKAPIYFFAARIALPVFLMLMTWLVMTQGEKEFESSQIVLYMVGMAFAGYLLPGILMKNHIQKRQAEINLVFPDALDMMLICVQGGIGLEQTVSRVADDIVDQSPLLAEELGILSAEMGMLNDRRAALKDFARRVGSGSARSFSTSIIQAEQYGTSVSNAMRVIADELRDARMAEAERKAAALPPKLTVPMILFFMPALFIVILGPAFVKASSDGYM